MQISSGLIWQAARLLRKKQFYHLILQLYNLVDFTILGTMICDSISCDPIAIQPFEIQTSNAI
jgi:hypothetical protein